MATILIAGASSGIGLAFLCHYASNPSNTIITCDQHPLPASGIPDGNRVHYIVDVTSEASIVACAAGLNGRSIDLVIYSIGVRGLVNHLHTSMAGSAQEAETLESMDVQTMMSTFQINTTGALMFLRAVLPNVRMVKERRGKEAKVVVMSSRMGSISANKVGGIGGGYAYRASKAALNAVVRSLSIDVPEVVWVICHPGRVESKLVRYKEEGAIGGAESVKGLVPVIEGWDKRDSGKFYDRFGEVIEW